MGVSHIVIFGTQAYGGLRQTQIQGHLGIETRGLLRQGNQLRVDSC